MIQAMHENATDPPLWQTVNDDVMGGRSSARVLDAGHAVRFEGVVSLDHGGGFASARRPVPPGGDGALGLRIRCRGDGHRYRLTAHAGHGRPAWHAAFDTRSGEETVVSFAWQDFRATWRGRPVPQAPAPDAATIDRIGVMLTKDGHRDGQGPFALEVLEIGWWR